MAHKLKVLVAGHDLKFWYPLQAALQDTGAFEFREDIWTGHDSHDPVHSQACLDWAEVIVAEWTLGNAVYYSKHKRPHQRLITRFHAQELRTPSPEALNLENVEKIVFVADHIRTEAIARFDLPADKTAVTYNLVDTEKMRRSKFGDCAFNLGMIGILPQIKRLDLGFDVLTELAKIDTRYRLNIKGTLPTTVPWLWARTAERTYYTRLFARINASEHRHRITFDPQGNDVAAWLQKIGYILSPSDTESFHLGLAEGTSSGALPIVWPRAGVDDLFPFALRGGDPAFVARQIDLYRRSAAADRLKAQGQTYVTQHYGRTRIRDQWRAHLEPQAPSKAGNAARHVKTVVIVWGIDEWDIFHRREMLTALAENMGDAAALLFIEPKSHFATLLKMLPHQAARLHRHALLEADWPAPNIAAMRLLAGGFPKGVAHDPLLAKPQKPGATAEAVARRFWGQDIDITHWLYKPDQMQHLPEGADFIYEVYDEYQMHFSTGEPIPDMVEMEPKALAAARHVFFTADVLANRKKAACTSWSVVSNGVNFDSFNRNIVPGTPPKGRPAIGYLGNLSDFFNWPLMLDLCRALPDMDFIFHGQVERQRMGDLAAIADQMMALPNTLFTGRISRPVSAAAVARYDALIIPFAINDAMHAVNPLKLWEYFATGRPVISTPMDAITLPEPVIRIADTVETWVAALRAAVVENDPKLRQDRIDLARKVDWRHLTRLHLDKVLSAPQKA